MLGIDPGTFKMGVGVVDASGADLALVYSGVLSPKRAASLPDRLYHLHTELIKVIEEWRPSVVAVEEPFVARNVHAAIAVGQAQAVALVAAASRGLPVSTYAPRAVKQAVTDYGGSSKEQVQEMVRVLLGLETPPRPTDASDALAVAICHINASQLDRVVIRE